MDWSARHAALADGPENWASVATATPADATHSLQSVYRGKTDLPWSLFSI